MALRVIVSEEKKPPLAGGGPYGTVRVNDQISSRSRNLNRHNSLYCVVEWSSDLPPIEKCFSPQHIDNYLCVII